MKALDVVPADLPGMQFMTRASIKDNQVWLKFVALNAID
jgi:hypothetical protein